MPAQFLGYFILPQMNLPMQTFKNSVDLCDYSVKLAYIQDSHQKEYAPNIWFVSVDIDTKGIPNLILLGL